VSIIAILFGGIIVHILKELVQRPRPLAEPLFEAIKINVCGRGLCGKNSFPSGHSQAAFSVATVLSGYYKKRLLLFYLLAGLTAFSRVYIGVHYPFDIIAGSMIGYLSAKLVLVVSQRFNVKEES
ncbi:phosphatase PAP2 family protein, partial [bacterium]|nr:phosphatase PAP2 family protein [bacterium]